MSMARLSALSKKVRFEDEILTFRKLSTEVSNKWRSQWIRRLSNERPSNVEIIRASIDGKLDEIREKREREIEKVYEKAVREKMDEEQLREHIQEVQRRQEALMENAVKEIRNSLELSDAIVVKIARPSSPWPHSTTSNGPVANTNNESACKVSQNNETISKKTPVPSSSTSLKKQAISRQACAAKANNSIVPNVHTLSTVGIVNQSIYSHNVEKVPNQIRSSVTAPHAIRKRSQPQVIGKKPQPNMVKQRNNSKPQVVAQRRQSQNFSQPQEVSSVAQPQEVEKSPEDIQLSSNSSHNMSSVIGAATSSDPQNIENKENGERMANLNPEDVQEVNLQPNFTASEAISTFQPSSDESSKIKIMDTGLHLILNKLQRDKGNKNTEISNTKSKKK